MLRSFGTYLNPADDLAWPVKVRAIDKDEYHFWRGTRDLFYRWCLDNCRDWPRERSNTVVSHGDLHLGNMGSYAAAGGWGRLAYGLVDFDESARLPFQFDLLQGIITFDLIARENGIELAPADREALHSTLFSTYADQLGKPTTNPGLAAMLKARDDVPYAEEVDQFTENGHFKRVIEKKGDISDILRPVDRATRNGMAGALAEAVQHDARLAALLKPYDTVDFEDCILDVAERTRVDSSGSQGLSKILVLLREPFRDQPGNGLIYLKQQIPAAAERAELVPAVPGPPGRRYVHDLDLLTHGQSLAASWCDLAGKSYWVSIKEPWSNEPKSTKIKNVAGLLKAAKVWATVVADGHAPFANVIRPKLTAALRQTIVDRATAYLAWEADAYRQFHNDDRVAADIARADAAMPVK